MAFQKGSQIRPELMRGDMSGFAQAAQFKAQEGQMWGQALEKVGQQVAGAIKQKQEKADKKAKDEAAARVLMSHIPGMTYADALAGVNGVGAETLLNMNEQNMQREAKAKEAQATADYRSAALGKEQQRIDMAQAAAGVGTQNAAAQKFAIDASTDTSQNVDWKQAASIYTEQGGRDLEGFIKSAEAAKGMTKGPDEFTTKTIGEFQVLLKNGEYVIGKGTNSDNTTPSSVRSAEAGVEAMAKARALYNDGTKEGRDKAKDILQQWKVMNKIGFPADVDKYFGDGAQPAGDMEAKQKRLAELRAKQGQ
jgi:hypothetical protein